MKLTDLCVAIAHDLLLSMRRLNIGVIVAMKYSFIYFEKNKTKNIRLIATCGRKGIV